MQARDDDTAPMDLVELSDEEPADTDITAPTGHTTRLDDLLSSALPVPVTDPPGSLPRISRSPVRRPPSLFDRPSRGSHPRRLARSALMILVMAAVGGTGVLAGRLLAASSPAASAPPAQTATSGATPTGSSTRTEVRVGRPADALATWASQVSQATGVPLVAVQAYGQAQLVLAADSPRCHLGWTTLAGIGEAASHHGQFAGATLTADGRSSPPILGPRADEAGRPRPDTDAGRFDTDAAADRAVGPMQLLPGQWSRYASDGDQDGVFDPYDIDDASLATARLLCDSGADLSQPAQWSSAVARLKPGNAFTRAVFDAADGFGARTRGAG
jgi:hypothetical protein